MRFIAGLFTVFAATPAFAYDIEQWPTKTTLGEVEVAVTGNFAWDTVDFSGDSRLADADGMRRREFGATAKQAGVWDAMVYFDFESRSWLDVYVRVESKALFGRDLGRVRVGYVKVPVGLEGVTSSRAGTFMELAAPVQAIYQGRRTGVEWSLERTRALFQAGAYGGTDLQGDNPGQTYAARAAWTPRKASGDVLHLGIAASRENPQGWTDGRGVGFAPSELLRADVAREGGRADYTADGGYLAASWLVTGESRSYSAGNVANPKPANGFGAIELAARYSTLDLDDGPVAGGRQHDWTFGANWYLTSHFKLQANYVRLNATRNGTTTRPDAVELRAQVHF